MGDAQKAYGERRITPSQTGHSLMSPPSIPDAYRVATPYLIVKGAADAIAFYKKALGATEVVRLADSTGKVMHAELLINDSRFMLADEFPDMGYRSPQSYGGSPVSFLIYVDDVDAQFARMISAGSKATLAVADQFDGDRRGTVTDPFGHVWLLASRKEEITKDEMQRRFDAMINQDGS
jgi:PhnB protein